MYYMTSFLGRTELSRGLENNNPGNLRFTSNAWQGKISKYKNTDSGKAFEQFKTVEYGIRAMLRDVVNDIINGKNTVRKLISSYAPPTENDTKTYVNVVSKKLGVNPDSQITLIDSAFMLLIARAIITHENGNSSGDLIKDSHIRTAISMLGKFETKGKLKVDSAVITLNTFLIPIIIFFYTVLTVAL